MVVFFLTKGATALRLVDARKVARGLPSNAKRRSDKRTACFCSDAAHSLPQTPGYRSRLAQPVPGSLTRPHMPPVERGFTSVRET
jgi:hypothetical protein